METTIGHKIFEEVKQWLAQNDAKLKACPLPHEFSIPLDRLTREPIPEPKIFCKWQCVKCGAIEDGREKFWYELGLAHAKR